MKGGERKGGGGKTVDRVKERVHEAYKGNGGEVCKI